MKERVPYKKPEFIRTIVKGLRKQETEAERKVREYLRNKNLGGYKFYRQKAIYVHTDEKKIHKFFIADFYYHQTKLIIEIDGNIHDEKTVKEYDQMREFLLQQGGYVIIRFTNDEVMQSVEKVIEKIKNIIESNKKSPL